MWVLIVVVAHVDVFGDLYEPNVVDSVKTIKFQTEKRCEQADALFSEHANVKAVCLRL